MNEHGCDRFGFLTLTRRKWAAFSADGLRENRLGTDPSPGSVAKSSRAARSGTLYNQEIMAAGLFMRKVATMTENRQYAEVAQPQLDWIMGCNHFDCSTIEGVGYNQPHRGGAFIPATPQIPGAVSIGVNEGSFSQESYGFANEYDMPPTGSTPWLMSEMASK